jgi:hypothetical protein
MNMSAPEMTKRITTTSSRQISKFVGVYYLLTILTGSFVLFFHSGPAVVADLIAGVIYFALTVVLYTLSRSGRQRQGP